VSGQTAPFFAIRLLNSNGSTDSGYTPGIAQTVELFSVVSAASIAGVTAAAFIGTTTCPRSCNTVVGSFSAPTGVSYLRQMSSCAGGMTQSSRQTLSSFKFSWTAPSMQTASVSFWAIVVGAGDTYVAVSGNFSSMAASASATASATPTPSHSSQSNQSLTLSPSATPTLSQISQSSQSNQSTQPLTPSASPTPTSTTVEVTLTSITRVRTVSNISTARPTASPTSSVTPIPSSSAVSRSLSPTPLALNPSPSSTSSPLSPTPSSTPDGLWANYNPPSNSATTCVALSNAAVILAGSMAVVLVLCMLYHFFKSKYNTVKKSKQPITITTNMPEVISSRFFYKRTDGNATWYVDTKTMQPSWSLPEDAVIIAEEV
jgi:hypothetical protein